MLITAPFIPVAQGANVRSSLGMCHPGACDSSNGLWLRGCQHGLSSSSEALTCVQVPERSGAGLLPLAATAGVPQAAARQGEAGRQCGVHPRVELLLRTSIAAAEGWCAANHAAAAEDLMHPQMGC